MRSTDPEDAIETAKRMRDHLPLVLVLAADSPFWHGRDSGLASARTSDLLGLSAEQASRAPSDLAIDDSVRVRSSKEQVREDYGDRG